MRADCEATTTVVVPADMAGVPQSGATGGYGLDVPAVHGNEPHCIRVAALRAPGDSALSAPLVLAPAASPGDPVAGSANIVFP
jgi:hypothetical protein